ncbi:MAG: hypothetical protein LBV79_09860 [Candidatus Adiutrix sp.]|jgi:hypothetical protein|nr:hypothetical protein [Candidatus Adiutrix sp.]
MLADDTQYADIGEPGQDDELDFTVSGPATGWTDRDTRILDKALDLAGLTGEAERLRAGLAVDLMGVVILAPLVETALDVQAQLRNFFESRQGGIGK